MAAEPQPSTSAEADYLESMTTEEMEDELLNKLLEEEERQVEKRKEIADNKILMEAVNAEEYLEQKGADMLEFEKEMFLDMVHVDGLMVCGKGISYEKVLINLIKVYCHPTKLILILNGSDSDEKLFTTVLGKEVVREISSNQNDRQQVYNDGGVAFITTRILVVDLLKQRIPVESIVGIFVLRAHEIIESCQEAFALRLYRRVNKVGFIKAFSMSVEAFTYGYGHVEKVMRNLFIRKLFVWPRFHMAIKRCLKQFEPPVIELQIPMTAKMTVIQTHILDLMNYTVAEIKRLNRFVDTEEITVENCVTKKFHKILQSQLDSIWHQLTSHTKLLVADLKVLRSLMLSTIYNDCVTLFKTMKKYRSTEYALTNSGWILLESAELMFKTTKDRVFNEKGEFDPELPPKWKALFEILRVEIPGDLKREARTQRNSRILKDPVKVLILCSDSRSCYQLNQYLTQGGERYLFHTALQHEIPVAKLSDAIKRNCQSLGTSEFNIQSEWEKKEDAKTGKKGNASTTAAGETKSGKRFLKDRIKDKEEIAKIEEEKLEFEMNLKDENEDDGVEELRDAYVLKMTQNPDATIEEVDELNSTLLSCGNFETFSEATDLNLTTVLNQAEAPIICIQTFKSAQFGGLGSLEKTLHEIDPKYIVMYHSNVTAIRQIEIFEGRKNRPPEKRTKVFFLLHNQTVEEQSYLTSLRREKQAFELLISTMSKMVVPEYQDGKSDEMHLRASTQVELRGNEATRHGGGDELQPVVFQRIIVDVREFRSELPCLIHKRGIDVVPVMIGVGDYILTPDICVERKSISDLIGSLNSGRLYNQCIQMTRFYAKPILLIEFDQNKPFHLQGRYIIGGDITSNTDITHKLQLLTLHFRKVKLVWSPSPYATAKLFEELKLGKPEPDAERAAAIGSDVGADMEIMVDKFNTQIYDFLLKLPGINNNNVGKLMKNVKNFKDLQAKSEEELKELLNGEQNAKMLWQILHVAHKPIENNEKEKLFVGRKMGKRKF